jgi:hypothetical protein
VHVCLRQVFLHSDEVSNREIGDEVLNEQCILYPTLDLNNLLQLFLVEYLKLNEITLMLLIGILEVACFKESQSNLQKVLDRAHLTQDSHNIHLVLW